MLSDRGVGDVKFVAAEARFGQNLGSASLTVGQCVATDCGSFRQKSRTRMSLARRQISLP